MSRSQHKPKFTWGDSVRVSAAAPPKFRRGEYAAVCSIREPDDTFSEYRYLIEYADGSSVEIAEGHIGPDDTPNTILRDGTAKV